MGNQQVDGDWYEEYRRLCDRRGVGTKPPEGFFQFLAESAEDYARERQEKGAAVLSALLDANDATEAKRKAMHVARQKPRGGYRNKK